MGLGERERVGEIESRRKWKEEDEGRHNRKRERERVEEGEEDGGERGRRKMERDG